MKMEQIVFLETEANDIRYNYFTNEIIVATYAGLFFSRCQQNPAWKSDNV